MLKKNRKITMEEYTRKEVIVPDVKPRWYQDLSIPQMQNVFALGDIMRVDYAERVTGRTQRALCDIGVTSTFVKITAEQIKKLRRLADLDPVKFLCEIYRNITGQSFVDEEYKKFYDCNERIVLSAIAFLTLPETICELHRRLPMGEATSYPPKPAPGKPPPNRREKSPYLEPLFPRPEWLTYKLEMDNWRKECQRIGIPRVILPSSCPDSAIDGDPSIVGIESTDGGSETKLESYQEEKPDKKKDSSSVQRIGSKEQFLQEENLFDKDGEGTQRGDALAFALRHADPKSVKDKFDKKRIGYPGQKYKAGKSWLGEKDTQLIITGSTVNDDLSEYPISLETGGLAYVTPDNSDENFFAALSLDNAIRKTYPRGRENLSRKWQEWLLNMDEDYMRVEKEANKILESFEKTLKLIGPEAACDSCCACRQTKKANIKYHKTKTPHMVIDSIALDEKHNKYIVGSLAMSSPAPSPSGSKEDLPEIIPSHDKIMRTRIVSGVTNEMGEMTYCVSGVSKYVEHVPETIVTYDVGPKPIKNVPPCGCAIQKTINEGRSGVSSDDNILWTKNQQACIGGKYRPKAGGASSCREYPNDRSCRRNPFKKKVAEGIEAALRMKENAGKDNYPPKEKNMYSIADFQPCGDEDGMAVCGGPWGAVNIPDAEELARRAAEAKLILESPPCGDKPGRAICGADFGARHPIPKKRKKGDDEEEEEEEEELDEEELEERKKRDREVEKKTPEKKVEKLLNRDPRCSTAPNAKSSTEKSGGTAGASSGQKLRQPKIRKEKMEKILKADNEESESEFDRKAPKSEHQLSPSAQNLSKSKVKLPGKSKVEVHQEDPETTKKRKIKEIKDEWKKMKRLSNKFLETSPSLPEEQPKMCTREVRPVCDEDSTEETKPSEEPTKKGPFGWRTESEQKLRPEKTLVYLVEPNDPIDRVPVRPGGKPCECRENRNAQKTLLYSVSGMTEDGKGRRNEGPSRVIDGLLYITPVPSVRNSDEYIPEYELSDLPDLQCLKEMKDDNFKYIEEYLGPKSLLGNKSKASVPCPCSTKDKADNEVKSQEQNENEKKLMIQNYIGENAEKKSALAIQDKSLAEFYSRCRENVPCWLRCIEFSNDGRCTYRRKLQVKRPVCECKYERKIVKRDEEKENWLRRQARLKNHKKLPLKQVEGLSRPIRTETNIVVSNVNRICREDDTVDDIEYCLDGVVQSRVMGPAEWITSGIGMHTPLVTPEQSKEKFNVMKIHKHLSPSNIQPRPVVFTVAQTVQQRNVKQTSSKQDYRSQADKISAERLRNKNPNPITKDDKHSGKNVVRSKEVDKKFKNLSSTTATSQRSTEANRSAHGTANKKSTTKMLGQTDKINVRKQKSAGSLRSKTGKTVSQENIKKIPSMTDLQSMLKVELEKMANEGFLFAKLPACWEFPQLQWWLMYRRGFALPPEEKQRLMAQSVAVWNAADKQISKKILAPMFEDPQEVQDNWNFDDADRIKHEIAAMKEMYYSKIRKMRILKAREMWGLMEFGKFPGISFKRAYFTYQANKEADGFVFKPWENK